jgi:hypothetical protein
MLVHDWAVRLADGVSPNEAILAPIVLEAFLAGGEERQALFARSGSTLGGFGAGDFAAVMPSLFQALMVAGPMLVTALSSTAAENVISGLDNVTKLLELRKHDKLNPVKGPKGRAERHDRQDQGGEPPRAAVEALPPQVLQVVEMMRAELKKSGIKSETCDAVSYRALKVLFTDPQGASQFLRAIQLP